MKNEGDKTMKKVLLTSAAALAVFTVAPVFANGENPASTNQLLQKKYVSERDIAEEANRQVAFHDSEIRTDAERQFKEQGNKSLADAEKALQDFLYSGYSGHDFSDKKAALEANIAAAKEKSNQTFADIYSKVKNRYVQKLQEQYRATAIAEGKYYNDVDGVEDNKPGNTRISEDQANQGTQVAKGWVKDTKGQWSYVLDEKGTKATSWKQIDGKWYFFNAEGVMQKWWVKDGNTWYYLNGSGEMQTGWLLDGGKWYFLEASGAMKASQWFQVKDKWYHVDGSGALSVNTTVGGYTVNGNGEWVK
jgi:choline binding protein cbp1